MDEADVAVALVEDMLQALDHAGAARAIAARAQASLEADVAAVFTADLAARALEPVAWLDLPRPEAVALDSPALLAEAVRTGRMGSLATREEIASQPPPIGALARLGIESLLAAPLLDGGSPLGLLVAGWRHAMPMDDPASTQVAATARACGLGLRLLGRLRAEARTTAIRNAAEAIEQGLPLRGLLLRLVETARELTGARYGALGMIEPGQTRLREFVWSGISDEQAARIGSPPTGAGLLGAVVREARAIRVTDLRSDPRSCGMPPGHPAMGSFLGVPLRVGREVFGNFYLADKEGGAPFTAEDEHLVERLGIRAALAVGYAEQSALLEEKRQLLEVLLDQVPVGILLFDAPHGNILVANQAVRTILGRPIGPTRPTESRPGLQVLQHTDGTPISLEELPSWRALHGEVLVGAEFTTVRPDGTRVPLAINAAPFRRDGLVAGTVVTVQDISQRKELDLLREDCASIVTHDLRHPAVVIRMWADALFTRNAGSGVVSIPVGELQTLVRNIDDLSRMIDDLRDASRVDARRYELEKSAVAVPAALGGLIRVLGPALAERTVDVTTSGVPPPALVDPRRFDQVFTNLLTNAVKYSKPASTIRVTVEAADGGVLVSVADEGIGIAAEDLPRLFDRFYRARSGRGSTGLGLGLYIAKGIVEAHGGHISVESKPGRGSTFRVWLPKASL